MPKQRRARIQAWVHTARTAPLACPACQTMLDVATGVSLNPADTHPTPAPGNLSLCAYCGAVLLMTPAGWRLATPDEVHALPRELQELLAAYRPASAPSQRQ